jgi:hypothetical protein
MSMAIARGAWSIAGMYKSTHWPGSKVSDDSSSSSRAEVDGESGETSAIVAHVSGAAFACVESLRRTGKVSRDSRRSMCIEKVFCHERGVFFASSARKSLFAESLREFFSIFGLVSSKFMAPDHTASKSEPGSVQGLS